MFIRSAFTGTKIISHTLLVMSLALMIFMLHGKPEARTELRPDMKQLSGLIHDRLSSSIGSDGSRVSPEQYESPRLLQLFYEERDYRPAWIDEKWNFIGVEDFIKAVEEVHSDGLVPEYYNLQEIRELYSVLRAEAAASSTFYYNRTAELDILLTDSFLLLSCHLSSGCVNPVTVEAEWHTPHFSLDVASVLEMALREKRIRESLRDLRPRQGLYHRLRSTLADFRNMPMPDRWEPIPGSRPSLRRNDRSPKIREIRKRLIFWGDLKPDGAPEPDLFGEAIEKAVMGFQERHGLDPDGIIGKMTLKQINVQPAERIRQIEINLERLRWILRNLGDRYAMVNIADFSIAVVEKESPVLKMKVVVGRPYWNTPVFTDKMTYVVLNPAWNVPDSIAAGEILPKLKKDPAYLSEQNITVLSGWGSKPKVIDPATIDWANVDPEKFPYRFRQEPGIKNPLGRMKFMFPNTFNVYLHDSPAKSLFSKSVRTFSHGCIRLEKPAELLSYLFRDDEAWTMEKIDSILDAGKEKNIRLPEPLDVHIIYLTAWVDEDGTVQFRDDIYNRDRRLYEALRREPAPH